MEPGGQLRVRVPVGAAPLPVGAAPAPGVPVSAPVVAWSGLAVGAVDPLGVDVERD